MKEHNEQVMDSSVEQDEAKLPYEAPEVSVMGKVEQLTALGFSAAPDLLGKNLL